MAKTQEELNTLKNEYESLTNKLQELTGDELNMVTGGSTPGEGFKLIIRGSGIFGPSSPLYIVDGANKGNISSLDPNDIETISVLKD